MKTELMHCDIKDCKNTWEFKENYRKAEMQVIFHTEQTEGRCTEPYFQLLKLDMCGECGEKVMTSKRYLEAHGAQGHNTIYFGKPVKPLKGQEGEK